MSNQSGCASEVVEVAVEQVKRGIVVLEEGRDINAAIGVAACWCVCALDDDRK